MAENEAVTYQTFSNGEEARALAAALEAHGIPAVVANTSASFDPSFANNPVQQEYRVRIRQVDFGKADAFLLEDAAATLRAIPGDYYLFGFTDAELLDVLAKRDEWGKLDYLLARKLLAERGHPVDDATLETLQQQRLAALRQPDATAQSWIPLAYLSVLLGGVLGVLLGWHLFSYRKTLPDGSQVYGYTPTDRDHGKRIFWLGIVATGIWAVARLASGGSYRFFHFF